MLMIMMVVLDPKNVPAQQPINHTLRFQEHHPLTSLTIQVQPRCEFGSMSIRKQWRS